MQRIRTLVPPVLSARDQTAPPQQAKSRTRADAGKVPCDHGNFTVARIAILLRERSMRLAHFGYRIRDQDPRPIHA
jgi:hypothetical protein